jgi:hypothetical protein
VRVLHQVPTALYVEVAGRCVGVVAPAAAQVPCALRVSDAQVLAQPGAKAYLERGTLYLTDDPLVVGRFVDVRVPRIDPDRILRRAAGPAVVPTVPPRREPEGLAAYEGHLVPLPFHGKEPEGLAAYNPLPTTLDRETVHRLVGHGGGLTPLGDDVLCGWLAVLHATDRLAAEVADLVREAMPRTTVLSATLLDCALHGEVLPEFATYVAALGTPDEPDAAGRLMAIGHTSGAGLWFGAEHALRTLTMEAAA